MAHTPEELGKAYRVLAALITCVIVISAVTIGVRASYGAFSKDFRVSGIFPRAGQALQQGSDVKYRGVTVGKVRHVELVSRKVRITLALKQGVKVPADVAATVRPKTLFGEKYVDLTAPSGDRGPFLANGSQLRSTGTSEEVEGFVSGVDTLFRGIDKTELGTLMTELTQAAQGEGDRVAHAIDRGVAASNVFNDTLDAQLRALDSFARFMREYRDIAPDFNGTSANLNRFLPQFNQARADFERLLVTLRPFADHVADFLVTNEPNIKSLMDNGDNIVRVIIAHKKDISDVVYGLSRYTYKFAKARSQEVLPDGSRLGYFKLFIDVGDIRQMLCSIFTAPVNQSQIAQLQAALNKANPLLSCSASVRATGSGKGSGSGTAPSRSTPTAPGSSSAQQRITQQVLDQLGKPQNQSGGPGVVASLFAPALGVGG
ncbi:MAG: mammalian cell entry protein [Acidimicrobiales bacterium]|nr:mammalian cell entry protein [Acidimicrobiales bacterium]